MQAKINLKGKRVAVEKIKTQEKSETSFLVMPDSEEYLGRVRYVGPDADPTIQVGQKVYFSTNYQQCRIGGKDLCIMNDSEIFATVTEG